MTSQKMIFLQTISLRIQNPKEAFAISARYLPSWTPIYLGECFRNDLPSKEYICKLKRSSFPDKERKVEVIDALSTQKAG